MKNKKLKILVSLILLITFLSIPALALLNHNNLICWDCHINGRFSYIVEPEDDDYCISCHKYSSQQAREEIHNPGTCRVCHKIKESKTFHTIHLNNTCATCHGETGIAKPDKTMIDCGGCHGGKIHDIHQENLEQLCLTCHGKVPPSTPQQIAGSSNSVNQLYAKVVNYKEYTLFEILKKILVWK